MKTERVPIDEPTPDPANARKHDERNLKAIIDSLRAFGQQKPIVVDGRGIVVAGNGTLEAAKRLGWSDIAIVRSDLDPTQATAFGIADNRTAELADWDSDVLRSLLDSMDDDLREVVSFADEELDALLEKSTGEPGSSDAEDDTPRPSLSDRFGVPPFSILDQRQGYWQDRRRRWLGLGIASEKGRPDHLLALGETGLQSQFYTKKKAKEKELGRSLSYEEYVEHHHPPSEVPHEQGTSIFDPVLAEVLVRWFSPVGGTVLDPFAGGSVRGIVSATLGRDYVGVDLRADQVEANQTQLKDISGRVSIPASPRWIEGDSRQIKSLVPAGHEYDLVLSCPPYADLERYSDDPADLSTLDYEDFLASYREIIAACVDLMAEDSFAAWVVGEIRDRNGIYRGFVPDTVRAFVDAGASLYNEATLVQNASSAGIRAARYLERGRKLVKTHQNVLVFVKGDPKRATVRCGDLAWDEAAFEGLDDGAA